MWVEDVVVLVIGGFNHCEDLPVTDSTGGKVLSEGLPRGVADGEAAGGFEFRHPSSEAPEGVPSDSASHARYQKSRQSLTDENVHCWAEDFLDLACVGFDSILGKLPRSGLFCVNPRLKEAVENVICVCGDPECAQGEAHALYIIPH